MYQRMDVSMVRDEPERWNKTADKLGKFLKSVSTFDKKTIKWTEGIAVKEIIEDKAIFSRRGEQRM